MEIDRRASVAKLREDIINVLNDSGVTPEEAAFAFGLILGTTCKPYGEAVNLSTRDGRKALEGFVSDGMKKVLEEIKRQEFKTKNVEG